MTLYEAWEKCNIGDRVKHIPTGKTILKELGEYPRTIGKTEEYMLDEMLKDEIIVWPLKVIFSDKWEVAKTRHTGWMNVYKLTDLGRNRTGANIFKTKNEALQNRTSFIHTVDTIKVTWEE